MAWGFRKRIKILPGVTLNLSKSGVSTTVGPKGASINLGRKGVHRNLGLPGTGLYSRSKIAPTKDAKNTAEKVRVGAQVSAELAARIEAFAAENGISRPEAIRRLVERGLAVE